ncbi:DUF308 domain-containing protein [Nocardioides panacisoli]|uniref:HdeD family acid-resistance protein n=1 Tax=Nocardioides panacisoli TaxID=627624 RepID=UPI001C62A74E|nr:DUF308 domain-containing protein [Nocardioides panacisoli]QYJ04835.1 DUF308 domain-containing protein [Nocardioides panacisoli]
MTDAVAATGPTWEARRTKGDLVLGGLLVLAAIVLLLHVVVATAVSVLFLGWAMLLSGVMALVVSVIGVGRDGFWTGLLAGGLLTVLGLVMVRNPGLAAVSLTLIAGTTFLVSGVVRLVAAFQEEAGRAALLLGGGVSTLLGLMVLFNLFSASFTVLGVILGIQVLAEGLSLMIAGRIRTIAPAAT